MKTKSATKTGQLVDAAHSSENSVAELPTVPSTFKLILVPIDFSDCSLSGLNYAGILARKLGARLTLLHVIEPAIHSDNFLNPASADAANASLIGASREKLNKLTQRTAAQGLVAETLVRMGRAQSDIADTANATGADLIVMGAHGGGAQNQAPLGGTAERVLRHSPCPVLTVPYPKKG